MSKDEWEVPNSDDDEPGYLPKPERIVSIYNELAKGNIPNLEVKILPRIDPESIRSTQQETSITSVEKSEPKETDQTAFDEANEFDFDSQTVDTVKRFTPKRAPSKAQVKKVARMDQVYSKIIKYNKQDAEQQHADKVT